MGLKDGKCDSCEKEVDVLFPIGILDELPSGGESMLQKWYCVECKDTIEAEAEDIEIDDIDDDKKR